MHRCCLALTLRNIARRVIGRSTLDTTGPVVAGACLERYHRALTNYSLQLTLASAPEETSSASAISSPAAATAALAAAGNRVAIYRVDYRGAQQSPRAGAGPDEPSVAASDYLWTPVVAVHAFSARRPKSRAPGEAGYVSYLEAWRARSVFRNGSDGCRLPVDNGTRHWVPGTATRLGRYWSMVV